MNGVELEFLWPRSAPDSSGALPKVLTFKEAELPFCSLLGEILHPRTCRQSGTETSGPPPLGTNAAYTKEAADCCFGRKNLQDTILWYFVTRVSSVVRWFVNELSSSSLGLFWCAPLPLGWCFPAKGAAEGCYPAGAGRCPGACSAYLKAEPLEAGCVAIR